jgi:hypothetical protein
MYVCQWHLEIPYGKQSEVVAILKAWGAEKFTSSQFRRAKASRMLVGHIGQSASHLIDEYEFESLADFEAALADMAQPQFRQHSQALSPYVLAGSQRWIVLKTLA